MATRDYGEKLYVAPIGPETPATIESRRAAMLERIEQRTRFPAPARSLPDPGEGPTPERLAKAGDLVEEFTPADAEHHKAKRMLDGSPLDVLRERGKRNPAKGINADQYHAGFRFYSDWYQAGFAASGVIDPAKERVDCEGAHDISDRVLAAQTRFNHAVKALDYDAKHILDDVVLMETPLNIYADRFREFAQHRERRAIALMLIRKGLDQLARHYLPPRRDGIRAHMQDGARPIIMPSGEES